MRSLALLLILAALWGGSFVFMRVAVPALGPVPLAFARVALATLALLALAVAQRRIPDFRARWREFAVVGIVNSALPFVLFCYAEQYVTASVAAILNATSPFFGAIAAAIWLGEPLTWRTVGRDAAGARRRRRAGRLASGDDHLRYRARDRARALRPRSATGWLAYTPSGSLRACRASPVACASQLAAAVALAPRCRSRPCPVRCRRW